MKVLFLFCTLVLTSGFFSTNEDHAFHLSKTDIVYQPKEKTLQLTMHIFIDDLEVALEKQGKKSLSVGTEKEKAGVNDLINQYVQQNFGLTVNNKKTPLLFVGKEATADKQALWVYLEIKDVKNINSLTVENKMLTEVYPDQKNLVQVIVPTKKAHSFVLERGKTTNTARF
ncbi:MAG: DUF6702 family protein [Saprospiraceae bacterium]|nr:DUF6702 family protein [Saprospiraceae bacterium]